MTSLWRFWSYLTLSVMAGKSSTFSAILVKLDLMNITLKIIWYIFYILRHEEFHSRDNWWIVILHFYVLLFLILLQHHRGVLLIVKPKFIKKYKHVLSGVAEPRTDIFKNGSGLRIDFSKIALNIPVVLVSFLNRLSPDSAILMLSEIALPFQGATEQGTEDLAPKFFNACAFRLEINKATCIPLFHIYTWSLSYLPRWESIFLLNPQGGKNVLYLSPLLYCTDISFQFAFRSLRTHFCFLFSLSQCKELLCAFLSS